METVNVQHSASATPQEAEEQAYKQSTTGHPSALTRYLLEAVGPRLTAASIGLADGRQLRRWAAGEGVPRQQVQENRLRVLFRVVFEITAVYDAATAATFMRSANPQLDDSPPLAVLRANEDEPDALEDQRRVLEAARAFLEG